VTLIYRSDVTQRMRGTVSSANMGAGTMTVTVGAGDFVGTGSYSDWLVILSAYEVPAFASATDVVTGTDATRAVSSKTLADAGAFGVLTDAATVAWAVPSIGNNAIVTLGGSRTIGAPTGLYDGLPLILGIKQDGTGSRVPSFNALWDFRAIGAPVFSTAAGKKDFLFGFYDADTTKIIVTGFSKSA
jgi:hypothetical protein